MHSWWQWKDFCGFAVSSESPWTLSHSPINFRMHFFVYSAQSSYVRSFRFLLAVRVDVPRCGTCAVDPLHAGKKIFFSIVPSSRFNRFWFTQRDARRFRSVQISQTNQEEFIWKKWRLQPTKRVKEGQKWIIKILWKVKYKSSALSFPPAFSLSVQRKSSNFLIFQHNFLCAKSAQKFFSFQRSKESGKIDSLAKAYKNPMLQEAG